MFYALNKDGVKIDAYEAIENEQYFCPICNNPVILKRGQVNTAHFAHENNVCDDEWNYDMSPWHKRMQNNFAKEAHEVVVSHQGKKHRADVLIGEIVIEFQFSPITAAEFEDRNTFFKSAGYRLAWVFNLSQISEENLHESDEKENMMIWKHSMRIFANSDYLGETNDKFALWFSYYGDSEYEENGAEALQRVIWAIKDDDGCYSMKRFLTMPYLIVMNGKGKINPNHFFYSKKDFFLDEVSLLKDKHEFSIKYRGEKGKTKQSYICPRKSNEFGIDIWGEKGCCYCQYCYMVARTGTGNSKKYASYCCYPKQVRELCEAHLGYECSQVKIYEL